VAAGVFEIEYTIFAHPGPGKKQRDENLVGFKMSLREQFTTNVLPGWTEVPQSVKSDIFS
jgi:hypothetical protein